VFPQETTLEAQSTIMSTKDLVSSLSRQQLFTTDKVIT